jgi:DNA-binding GntR family transcriptional regulator
MNNGITGIPDTGEPATLGDQAFDRMRQMIIEGDLPPGKWLRKRQISSLLNMSPTPVIEAMRRLQHDGLVEINPRWGARVKTWTVSEIAQLADMRVALEGTVARRAAETLDSDQIASLRVIAVATDEMDAKFESPVDSAHVENGSIFQYDLHFHRALARETGLMLIAREINRLRVLQATCRLMVRPAAPTAVSHQQILDAIETHDGDVAEQAMRLHIKSNTDHYLPKLRERFGDGPVVWNDAKRGNMDADVQGDNGSD